MRRSILEVENALYQYVEWLKQPNFGDLTIEDIDIEPYS